MNKFYSIIFTLLILPAVCVAAEKEPTRLADSWTMIPKDGHVSEFEAAFKEHLAERIKKGDTRHWQVYVPVTGSNLNRYIIRSCCSEWSELDTYRKWTEEKLGDHFNETVAPHVQSYSHNFSEIDNENSHWGDDVKANYVGYTHFDTKVGKGKASAEAIKTMSTLAKDHNWPYNWAWSYPVGGSGGVGLVNAYENYAAMAPAEENFYQFIVKHMGSEKKADKLFKSFNATFDEADYTIFRHRKDLSMSEMNE